MPPSSLPLCLCQVHSHVDRARNANVGEASRCPVLAPGAGCPFTTACSDGKPLVAALDNLRWCEGQLGQVTSPTSRNPSSSVSGPSLPKPATTARAQVDGEAESPPLLSVELKHGTSAAHKEAENVAFVKAFIRKEVTREGYIHFLSSLYFVYRALEKVAEAAADDEIWGPMHMPNDLARTATLEQDLEYFCGPQWQVLSAETAFHCVVPVDMVAANVHALILNASRPQSRLIPFVLCLSVPFLCPFCAVLCGTRVEISPPVTRHPGIR